MTALIVVCGAPGAGKSSAVSAALSGYVRAPMEGAGGPARDALFESGRLVAVELGRHRDDFPGTDTLPMNINPVACGYLASPPEAPPAIVAEGARLSNRRFLTAGVEAGMRVTLLWLDNPLADRWRAERAARLGSTQNESWARGRATAARNLAAGAPDGVRVVRVTTPGAATVALRDLLTEGKETHSG